MTVGGYLAEPARATPRARAISAIVPRPHPLGASNELGPPSLGYPRTPVRSESEPFRAVRHRGRVRGRSRAGITRSSAHVAGRGRCSSAVCGGGSRSSRSRRACVGGAVDPCAGRWTRDGWSASGRGTRVAAVGAAGFGRRGRDRWRRWPDPGATDKCAYGTVRRYRGRRTGCDCRWARGDGGVRDRDGGPPDHTELRATQTTTLGSTELGRRARTAAPRAV